MWPLFSLFERESTGIVRIVLFTFFIRPIEDFGSLNGVEGCRSECFLFLGRVD